MEGSDNGIERFPPPVRRPWYRRPAPQTLIGVLFAGLVTGVASGQAEKVLTRIEKVLSGDSTAKPSDSTTTIASTTTTATTQALTTTITEPPSTTTDVAVEAAPTFTVPTMPALAIARLNIEPSDYYRIPGSSTWKTGNYSKTVAFTYGWRVYNAAGQSISDRACFVVGNIKSTTGTDFGSRHYYCGDGSAGYTYLPPGNYRLTVTAAIEGTSSSRQATFDFNVVAGEG